MRLNVRSLLEYALCLACIALVAGIALHPVLHGAVPGDTEGIFFLPPWEDARSSDMDVDTPVEPSIETTRYLPWRLFLSRGLDENESLLWNPNESCGMPYYALWRSRTLSPFTAPFYLLPLEQALQVSAWLKLVVAGLCALIMARMFGLPLPMALVVGLTYQLSGLLLSGLGQPISDVMPWLPLLVLFVDRLSLDLRHMWPWTVLVLTAMLLGGEPEAVFGASLFCLLFAKFRMLLGRTARHNMIGIGLTLTTVILAAIGLAAVQIVPYIEFVREAVIPAQRTESIPSILDIVSAVMPRFLSSVQEAGASPLTSAPHLFYMGLLPLALLPLWFALRGFPAAIRRVRVEAMLLATLVMTLLGTIGTHLFHSIPILNLITPAHLMIGNVLAIALMAAESADEWIELDAIGCKQTLKRLALTVPIFLIFVIIAIVVRMSDFNPDGPTLLRQIVTVLVLLIALNVLLTVTLLRPSTQLMGYALAFLITIDLLMIFQPSMRFTEPEHLYPETPFIESLKGMDERVGGTHGIQSWPLAANDVPQLYSASGIHMRRHAAFIQEVENRPLLMRRLGSRALLLTREDVQQGPFTQIRHMLAVEHVFPTGAMLFNDLGAKPRAWVAYSGREVEEFDPAMLDEEAPPLVENVVPPASAPEPEAEARIVEESHTRIVVHVDDNTRPGILVLADSWYPGWRATVNGEPSEVFPVDGVSRGVLLTEGDNEVIFTFRPISLWIGLAISIVTGLFVFIWGVRSAVEQWRNREIWR